MKRICSVCKIEKKLEDFYRNKIEKHGREYRCKDCSAKKCKKYFQEKLKEDPDYYNKQAKRNRQNYYAWCERNYEERKEKIYAGSYIGHLIEKKTLIRPIECSQCLEKGKIEAHHDDYRKPQEIRWLCTKCHRKADKIRRENEHNTLSRIFPNNSSTKSESSNH